MNYYKDNQNNVYAYSDIQTPKDGLTKITEQEALELTNPPKTDEQLKVEAESLASSLRYKADAELIPLQDAIDLDMATDDELSRAKELKKFRVLLSRWSYPDDMPEYPL